MGQNGGLVRLMALADAVGWRYVRESGGGGHLLFHHEGTRDIPATGLWMTVPKNVTEGRGTHNMANLARDLLRNAGLAARDSAPVPGLRRRPKPPSGESRERKETAAVRAADIRHLAKLAAVERRARQDLFWRRMMLP